VKEEGSKCVKIYEHFFSLDETGENYLVNISGEIVKKVDVNGDGENYSREW